MTDGRSITLPGNEVIAGTNAIVILGANGSGKTRKAREITSEAPIEFVNALRMTRVASSLPSMPVVDAENQLRSHVSNARNNHWEPQSDFDFLLTKLHSKDADAARQFREDVRKGLPAPEDLSEMDRVRAIWGAVFPGRHLYFKDNSPTIRSDVNPYAPLEYTANTMSDAERAALYLTAKVVNAPAGVLIIDEPEHHFQSLLAVQLWNILEAARPDVRFVYITHDLPFALSRPGATYVLASPSDGLKTLPLDSELPTDVSEALLGVASFSFHARQVVFCEGEETSWDVKLFRAWFNRTDTVVKPVGSCDSVIRCTTALPDAKIATGLTSAGIIDGDYLPDAFIQAIPDGVSVLQVHEIESLMMTPAVVAAVASHSGREFDLHAYETAIRSAYSEEARHQVILERWKRRLEPLMTAVVASVHTKDESLDSIIESIPSKFDYHTWSVAPDKALLAEKYAVEAMVPGGTVSDILRVMPGKQLKSLAPKFTGLQFEDYFNLVTGALSGTNVKHAALGVDLEAALAPYLPPRDAA